MKKPECAICNEVNDDNSYGWIEGTGLVHKVCYHEKQPRNFVRGEETKSANDGKSTTINVDTQTAGSRAN